MATHTPIRSSVAVALTAAALLAGTVRPAAAVRSGCGGTTTLLAADTSVSLGVTETRRFAASVAPAYGWPVKPFDRPHPVRANFDDPRIGAGGSVVQGIRLHAGARDRGDPRGDAESVVCSSLLRKQEPSDFAFAAAKGTGPLLSQGRRRGWRRSITVAPAKAGAQRLTPARNTNHASTDSISQSAGSSSPASMPLG